MSTECGIGCAKISEIPRTARKDTICGAVEKLRLRNEPLLGVPATALDAALYPTIN